MIEIGAVGPQAALEATLRLAQASRAEVRGRMVENGELSDAYGAVFSRLRELCLLNPHQGEPSPREFAKAARSASPEARRALALLGPGDGVARGLMKHLALLDLGPVDRLHGALLCALEDAEHTLANLQAAQLALEEQLLVVLAAMKHHPVLDFEEYKSIETVYQSSPSGGPEAQELQRRFEQARGRRSQHGRRHLLNQIPEALKGQGGPWFEILKASLVRDPFGSLDCLGSMDRASLDGLEVPRRLDLLDCVAACGQGLASTHLDLFGIPADPVWAPRLQQVLRMDLTAGASIFGVHALEGAHHYPFGLQNIEVTLPRRVTSGEALDYLRRGDPPSEKPRTFTPAEIDDAASSLQEQDFHRFLEVLKWDIGQKWKTCVGERKRDILFADPDLKIRNILFLLAQGLFQEDEVFENIHRIVQRAHPALAGDGPRILLLANRYYFLDTLGLNPGLLFHRSPRDGSMRTLAEEASDYPFHALLHLGMSIHLRVGDGLFRSMPIAWNMLLGQYEGRIDPVFQEIAFLFDGVDTLLTIAGPIIPDLRGWSSRLVDALAADAPELPAPSTDDPPMAPLRLTTRAMLFRYREGLNRYCLDALRRSAQAAGVSPITIIQGLRLPRSKTDKLRSLLEQERRKA